MKHWQALTPMQALALGEFYGAKATRVPLTKSERTALWESFRNREAIPLRHLDEECPTISNEIRKASSDERNLQSAVFSECVYAQALAGTLNLTTVIDANDATSHLTSGQLARIRDAGMKARYVYVGPADERMLIQAGGAGSVDAAIIGPESGQIISVEFKEPAAKTSEPDLPKYAEDGLLVSTKHFERSYPQFKGMVEEQLAARLSFFDKAGSNVNSFSAEAIVQAATENYMGTKFADVICVEDAQGVLTMIPANHIDRWASLKGEIRPAGRNSYSVWTPEALVTIVASKGGSISDNMIRIPVSELIESSPRGGGKGTSRFKLHPLFYARPEDVTISGNDAHIDVAKVKQLNPTISAHMFFHNLRYEEVKSFYLGLT